MVLLSALAYSFIVGLVAAAWFMAARPGASSYPCQGTADGWTRSGSGADMLPPGAARDVMPGHLAVPGRLPLSQTSPAGVPYGQVASSPDHAAFTLLDFRPARRDGDTDTAIVYAAGLTGELYLDKPHEVQQYRDAQAAILGYALDEAATVDLCRSTVAKELDGEQLARSCRPGRQGFHQPNLQARRRTLAARRCVRDEPDEPGEPGAGGGAYLRCGDSRHILFAQGVSPSRMRRVLE